MSRRPARRMRGLVKVLAASGMLALSGCAFNPALQRVAVDHNRMVAQAEDELTLLNIVRAAHRFPLHFTTVTQVNGNAKLTVGGGLDLGLETGADPNATELAAEVSSSPSFQASVLADDEFQRGIQAPIESELVAYYLDEGWRDELIMALFIERLEPIGSEGIDSRAIINDPASDSRFARLLCTHQLVTQPTSASKPLTVFDRLIDLTIIDGAASSPAQRRAEIEAFLKLTRQEGVHLNGDTLVLTGSNNSVKLVARERSRCGGVAADTSGIAYHPRFRSTLGVIYFLGEYLRTSEDSGLNAVYALPSCSDGTCIEGGFEQRPLIAVLSGGGDSLVATEFRGRRYYIASEEDRDLRYDRGSKPRSMQVVAIVQQLVNLQKSADSLPRSLSITGLN